MRKPKRVRRFESLESRRLMTCAPPNPGFCWQNEEVPADVSGDGHISPLDALLVINELDSRLFSDTESGELIDHPFDASDPTAEAHDFDVNGDDFVSPIDALGVLNALDTVPVLDLNGEAHGRMSPFQNLDWDADRTLLMPSDFVIRGGATGELDGVMISWPNLDEHEFLSDFNYIVTPELDVQIDTTGTQIQVERQENSITLAGRDTIASYQRVLANLELHATDRGERYRHSFNIEFEIKDGDSRSRAHVRFTAVGTEEQLVGLSTQEALDWATQRNIDRVRVIPPDGVVTLDYRPERLNVSVDDSGMVVRASFG